MPASSLARGLPLERVPPASEERGGAVSMLACAPSLIVGSPAHHGLDNSDQRFLSPTRLSAVWLHHLYRAWLSPVFGTSCPMHPSCSQYAVRAIESRGLLLGVSAAADRLLRCGHDRSLYTLVLVDGQYARFSDPPPCD